MEGTPISASARTGDGTTAGGGLSRRGILRAATLGGAGLAALAGGAVLATGGGAAAATHASAKETWLYLSILTGGMTGHKGWPEYVPADFTVNAGSLVHVEIRCFDNGPATVPSGYQNVKGTVGGTMQVLHSINGNIDKAKAVTVKSLKANGVAHTLTFAQLNLSVPVPPLSTVRFSIHAPKAGKYSWQCMAACGTGKSGWLGPMATNGYMEGTMHAV